MQIVDFKDQKNLLINFLFSFFVISKFIIKNIITFKIIRRIKFKLIVKKNKKTQNSPEILFWFLFFEALIKKIYVTYFQKKNFSGGESSLIKTISLLNTQSWNMNQNIYFLKILLNYILQNSDKWDLFVYFFKKNYNNIFNLHFKGIRFNTKFYQMITIEPWFWQDFDICIEILLNTHKTSLWSFLFQIINIPIVKKRLQISRNMKKKELSFQKNKKK